MPTNNEYRDNYKSIRNKVNKEIKTQKNNYYSKRIESHKHNMKKIWNEINHIIGKKK